MGITGDQLQSSQPTGFQALQKGSPVDFVLAQGDRNAQYLAFPAQIDAHGCQYSQVTHLSVLSDLLIIGIQEEIGIFAQRPIPPLLQLGVQQGSCSAHLGRRNRNAAQLLGDRFDLAGGDPLNIHLRQRQGQGSLAAQPFLQCFRVETAFTHLGHIKGDLPDPGMHGLRLETVGMSFSFRRPLVRCGVQVMLPLGLHSGVDDRPDQIRENV